MSVGRVLALDCGSSDEPIYHRSYILNRDLSRIFMESIFFFFFFTAASKVLISTEGSEDI